jgi:hypothetical protein
MNDTQTHITALLVAHRDMIDAQARGDQAAVVDAAQRMQALRAALTAGAAPSRNYFAEVGDPPESTAGVGGPAWCPIHEHHKWCEHNGGVMGPNGWEAPSGVKVPVLTDEQIDAVWHSPGPWSNEEIDYYAFARAILAAAAGVKAWCTFCGKSDHTEAACPTVTSGVALPREGQPVAWYDPTNTEPGQSVTFDRKVRDKWPHRYPVALYAAGVKGDQRG